MEDVKELLVVEDIYRDKHSHTTVFICVHVDSDDKSQWNMKSMSE